LQGQVVSGVGRAFHLGARRPQHDDREKDGEVSDETPLQDAIRYVRGEQRADVSADTNPNASQISQRIEI